MPPPSAIDNDLGHRCGGNLTNLAFNVFCCCRAPVYHLDKSSTPVSFHVQNDGTFSLELSFDSSLDDANVDSSLFIKRWLLFSDSISPPRLEVDDGICGCEGPPPPPPGVYHALVAFAFTFA